MATAYHHSLSSVKRWGGEVKDYIHIHEWFDASKALHGDFRHRALRHHAEGIQMCVQLFANPDDHTITNSTGRKVPVLWIGEQHVMEDMGFIPTFGDWAKQIEPEPWMNQPIKLSKILEKQGAA
jgi:hypothetical protein